MHTVGRSRRTSTKRNLTLTAAAAVATLALCGRHAEAGLTHRYSFEGNLNDSVGTLNGTAGGTDPTAFSNGTLLFTGTPGAAGNYVQLPAGLLPTGATSSVTLESFGNYRDTGDWPRIFDFGSGQAVNFFLTPRAGGGTDVRVRIKTTQTNAETGPIAAGSVLYGVDQTYTVVLDGVAKTLTMYRNGGLMGSAAITSSLDALAQTQNYLGKSQYPDANLGGAMDEFRVYDNALDQRQVIINHVLGSNTLTLSGTNSLTAAGPTDWTNNAAWSNGAKPVKTEFVNVTNGGSVNITSNVGAVPFTVVSNGTVNFNNTGRLYTGLDMAPGNSGSVTINLNAGSLLDTPRIFIDGGSGTNGTGAKIINFNGGTLHTAGQFTMQGTNLTTNVNADTTFDTDFGTVTWGVPLTLAAGAQNALLTKTGVGTLSFPGGYNGRLSVEMGVLAVGGNLPNTADLQLGRGTNGATLQFNAGVTVGAAKIVVGDNSTGGTFAITGNANATSTLPTLQLNRSLTINQVNTTGNNALNLGDINDGAPGGSDTLSRTLTFNNVGLVNVTGNITDPIAGIFLVKNNTGRTVLSGTNTFIGGTIVNTGILQYASPAAMGDFSFIENTVVLVNANGVVAPTATFGPLQPNLLGHIGNASTGGVGLIGDSAENLNFGSLPGLFLGSIVANSTYTGTLTPGGGNYRLGGGGGQITIPNANQLTGGNGLIVGGPNGGTGSVANTGGTVLLTAASNNYTGGTTLRANVTLQLTDKAQIGTGGLGFNGGNLRITGAAPFNWTTPVELTGGTTTITVDTTGGASFTAGMIPSNTNNTTLIKAGLGNMNISGTVNVNAGNVHVDGGTLTAGAGTVLTTGAFGSVGRLSGQTGTLIVKDDARYSVNGDFNISDLTNTVGYLFVQNTATLTPRTLYVGKGGTAQGIAVQSGGSVTSLAGPGDWRIGGGTGTGDVNSVGTYDLTAGTFSTTGNLQVGAFGQGTMYIAGGGTAGTTAGFPVIGRFTTGYGTLNVTNGSFTQGGTGQFMILGEQGTGILNVGGGTSAATVTVNGPQLRLGHTATGVGFANVAANGTIQARAINSALGTAVGVLNLHGGTLKAAAAGTFVSNLTNAFVWSEGGTIDSNGFDVTVAQPLVAPTGSGVSGVTITPPGANYVGHPLVKFTGGGGTGAAGVAVTDANGTVTGVQITNPGVGYTAAPTVQLLGAGPIGAGTAAATATIAAVAPSGGITKVGNGVLTLSSPANTYAGPTTVNAGTLRVTGSVFPSSGITVNNAATFEAPVTQKVRALTVAPGGTAVLPNPATGKTVLTVGDGATAASPLVLNAGASYGNLDLASNAMVVDVAPGAETATLTTVRQATLSAFAAGAWTGNGLRSASVTAANRQAIGFGLPADVPTAVTGGLFYGAAADDSSVVVRTTVAGDATLDSVVNFDDLLALAKSYNRTDAYWARGDFDYNAIVNFDDLLILAKNYNQVAAAPTVPSASAAFNADVAAAFAQAAVPEPAAAGILCGAALALAGGRRRRRRRDRPSQA
jgi:autotransporter-associated beta strand protein